MDILLSFAICFILLLVSVLKGISVVYPLTLSLGVFILYALRKGYKPREVLKMVYGGAKKSFVVLRIFILIGAIISIWMSAGTVPAIVYYGIKFLHPNFFILCAFLITCFVAFLIGTSFGTVGTAGIALMVMARSGGVSVAATAGAILAGAYFGDRCSPMSSSANLIVELTDTDIYTNMKNMFRTSFIPFVISVILYTIISFRFPLNHVQNTISADIMNTFHINFIALIPAIIILVFSALRINVKKSILVSIIVAIVISVLMQGEKLIDVVKYLFLGFTIKGETPLKEIIKGGGIISMLQPTLAVFISSAFTGIFEKTGMLRSIEDLVAKAKGRYQLFFAVVISSIVTSAFACTQVLSVILTHMIAQKAYTKHQVDKYEMALDLENSAIVIAPLIPWNIAVLVPLTNLMAGFDAIFYAFYLYLVPLTMLFTFKIYKNKNIEKKKPAYSEMRSSIS